MEKIIKHIEAVQPNGTHRCYQLFNENFVLVRRMSPEMLQILQLKYRIIQSRSQSLGPPPLLQCKRTYLEPEKVIYFRVIILRVSREYFLFFLLCVITSNISLSFKRVMKK